METLMGTRYISSLGYLYGRNVVHMLITAGAPKNAVHEFAHVVSLYVKSNFGNNPRWLWESAALYENNEFIDPADIDFMKSGNYPAMSELNADYNNSKSIYRIGYVIGEAIVEIWGKKSLWRLIRTNGDMRDTLGLTVDEFENRVYTFIENNYL